MRFFIATIGIISLILGVIGIFLPLLPTVPFVLLSAYLFAKSSTRLHNWILNHNIFGNYIKSYNKDKSIPLLVKILSIGMLWTSIFISIFFVLNEIYWLQILLVGIAIGVTTFLIKMKTR